MRVELSPYQRLFAQHADELPTPDQRMGEAQKFGFVVAIKSWKYNVGGLDAILVRKLFVADCQAVEQCEHLNHELAPLNRQLLVQVREVLVQIGIAALQFVGQAQVAIGVGFVEGRKNAVLVDKGHPKNSHMPMVDMYRRMVDGWTALGRPMAPLSAEKIKAIVAERIHPSNRK